MAKQITSGKRDREKQKEQKRKEKQRRKEERQSAGSSSFDEMLAYVDKNGVIHSSLEEAQAVDEIDASDIQISVPKKEEVEETPLIGRVDFFNSTRGFGFIRNDADGEKYFFHVSSAPEGIIEGDKVTYELERGTRGLSAVRISIIEK